MINFYKRFTPDRKTPALDTSARIALTCLTSRGSIIALLLLLFNDHFLKYAWPCWLTGKLSDFAGLYFAPFFFLTVVFFLIGRIDMALDGSSDHRRLSGHANKIAVAVFVVVGALFTGLKLSPGTAQAVLSLMEGFTGLPQTVVVDPTDLLALVVLPFTYWQWRRRWRQSESTPNGMRELRVNLKRVGQIVILGAAGFAVIATSAPPSSEVMDIAPALQTPGTLYACVLKQGPINSDAHFGLYKSSDGGNSWEERDIGGRRMLADPHRAGRYYLSTGLRVWVYDESQPKMSQGWPLGSQSLAQLREEQSGTLPLPSLDAPPWQAGAVFAVVQGKLAQSKDYGQNWQDLTSSLPIAGEAKAVVSAPSQEGRVYAVIGKSLLRSDDTGSSWINTGNVDLDGQLVMAVDPQNPDMVLVGGNTALLGTTDGGINWNNRSPLEEKDAQGQTLPANVTSIVFDPVSDNVVYAAAGGCLITSENDGLSWRRVGSDDIRSVVFVTASNQPLLAAGKYGVFRPRETLRWPWLTKWEQLQSIPGLQTLYDFEGGYPFLILFTLMAAGAVFVLYMFVRLVVFGSKKLSRPLPSNPANEFLVIASLGISFLVWPQSPTREIYLTLPGFDIAALLGIAVIVVLLKGNWSRVGQAALLLPLAILTISLWWSGMEVWSLLGLAALIIAVVQFRYERIRRVTPAIALPILLMVICAPGWLRVLLDLAGLVR